jgi:hypothetical protein
MLLGSDTRATPFTQEYLTSETMTNYIADKNTSGKSLRLDAFDLTYANLGALAAHGGAIDSWLMADSVIVGEFITSALEIYGMPCDGSMSKNDCGEVFAGSEGARALSSARSKDLVWYRRYWVEVVCISIWTMCGIVSLMVWRRYMQKGRKRTRVKF